MALSKQQLAVGMKRTCLNLEEKVKILSCLNENPKKSCTEIATDFQIGKTAAASILKDRKKLRKGLELFKGNYKARRASQFSLTNEIFYKQYGRSCSAGISPFGSMLQEKALKIKESLNDNSLDRFTASNGQLEIWKDV